MTAGSMRSRQKPGRSMNEFRRGFRAFLTGMLLPACLLPLGARAMAVGEPGVHSHFGQPLRLSLPISAAPDEDVEEKCFSLGRPPANLPSYAQQAYLTQAGFALERNAGRLSLKITTTRAINEPYVRLLLQVNCGPGPQTKEFAVLLDPVERRAPPQQSVPAVAAAVPSPAAAPATARTRASVEPGGPPPASGAARPRSVPPTPAAGAGEFRLRLSSHDLDLSALGTLTDEQRQVLREKQLLLDADDQVANTLSMKHRIRQLEEQIVEMRAEIDKTNGRLAMSEGMAAPAPPEVGAAPVRRDAVAPPAGNNLLDLLDDTSFRGMAGVVLILALMISVWWQWRRKRAEVRLERDFEEGFSPGSIAHYSLIAPPSPKAGAVREQAADEPDDDDLFHATSIFAGEDGAVSVAEADTVLDEADLYLAYGWSNRAIERLQGYLDGHQDDVQVWRKLFELYAGLGLKQEFEQLALRCQAALKDPELWGKVLQLGYRLDPENALYRAAADGAADKANAGPEIPTLTTPLEFTLDHELPSHYMPTEDRLDLDPLFPEQGAATPPPATPGGAGKNI